MLINEKYKEILPKEEFIIDDVILINAWKKSQQYIRSISWYVDYLDLDKSAIDLKERIKNLQATLLNKSYQLKELRLIPAPKISKWSFQDNTQAPYMKNLWRPEGYQNRSNIMK